jgi:hypothetical protein
MASLPPALPRLTLHDYQQRLLDQYGPLIGGPDLVRALGYRTQAAFDKARQEQRLGLHTFAIDGRRGRFAATDEFARWLWTQQFGDRPK